MTKQNPTHDQKFLFLVFLFGRQTKSDQERMILSWSDRRDLCLLKFIFSRTKTPIKRYQGQNSVSTRNRHSERPAQRIYDRHNVSRRGTAYSEDRYSERTAQRIYDRHSESRRGTAYRRQAQRIENRYGVSRTTTSYWGKVQRSGGEESRSGNEKRCSHNLQSGAGLKNDCACIRPDGVVLSQDRNLVPRASILLVSGRDRSPKRHPVQEAQ